MLKALRRDRSLLGTMFTSGAAQAILAVSGIGAARILGVADRGRLALLNLLPTVFVLIGTFGLPVAVTYFIARDPGNARAIARTALRSCGVLAILLTEANIIALILVFRGGPSYVTLATVISLPLVSANVAQLLGQALLQGQQRYRAYNWCRIAPAVTYALSIGALAALSAGTLVTLTLAFVATSTVVACVTLYVAVTGLPPRRPTHAAAPGTRGLFAFGSKAVLGAVYPTETFQLDQATVGLFLSPASLGLYVVGVAFTNLPRFIAQSLGVVAYPRISALRDPALARAMIRRFTEASVVVAALTCLTLEASVGFLIPLLFGPAFVPAVPITRILLVSAFIVSVRRVLADCLRGAGWPALGTVGEGVALLTLFPALALLIPDFGLRGAAEAVCISAAAGFLTLLILAQRASRRTARTGPTA